jgi:AraC family transcriptional regulator, regulatory protein of adaptative response / methylated-DNA-[protein]-cysteine methyltransferase
MSSPPRCFLSARDSEGVGALLAGTGLHPLTALWGVAAAWYASAVMSMDFAECDRARVARDPSYDGRFFTGVRTTGVYCRPVCPVRPARSINVQFFPSAAAAEAAGFRPCLRCRPETAPFSNAWIGSRATVERAVRLIVEEGALDEEGTSVEKLAERLGMGRRQLARLFDRHLQASPGAVARTARIHRAKRLIDETDKPMVEIAVLAGFGSLRRFNAVFAEVYGRAPTQIRRTRRSSRIRHEADPVRGNKNERARRLSNRSESIAAK